MLNVNAELRETKKTLREMGKFGINQGDTLYGIVVDHKDPVFLGHFNKPINHSIKFYRAKTVSGRSKAFSVIKNKIASREEFTRMLKEVSDEDTYDFLRVLKRALKYNLVRISANIYYIMVMMYEGKNVKSKKP